MPSTPASSSASVSARAAATIGCHAGIAVEGRGARQREQVDDPDHRLHDTEDALDDLSGGVVHAVHSCGASHGVRHRTQGRVLRMLGCVLTRQTVPGATDAWQASRRWPATTSCSRRSAVSPALRDDDAAGEDVLAARALDALAAAAPESERATRALRRAAAAARAACGTAPGGGHRRGCAGGAPRGPAGDDRGGDGGRARRGRRRAGPTRCTRATSSSRRRT